MEEKKLSIWKAILLMKLPLLLCIVPYIFYRFVFAGVPITSSNVTDTSLIISQYTLHFCYLLTVLYGFKKCNFSFCFGKQRLRKNDFFIVLLVSICFFMVAPLLFNLNLFFTNDLPVNSNSKSFWFTITYPIGSMVVLAPILEELLFKNIFNQLKKNYSISFSIFLVSLVFTFGHLYAFHWYSFANYFVFSIIGCIIFLKTESILLCIFFHFLSNLFIQISNPYNTFLYENIYTQYWYIFVLIFSTYAIIHLLSILRK